MDLDVRQLSEHSCNLWWYASFVEVNWLVLCTVLYVHKYLVFHQYFIVCSLCNVISGSVLLLLGLKVKLMVIWPVSSSSLHLRSGSWFAWDYAAVRRLLPALIVYSWTGSTVSSHTITLFSHSRSSATLPTLSRPLNEWMNEWMWLKWRYHS